MDNALRIELGEETVVGHCDSCGHETITFRGYVYNDEGAYAVYLCTYTASHPESGASMAVSIRGWGEGADNKVKECVALEWRNADSGPGCMVIDANKTSWASNHILGRMLSREEAITSGRGHEAFAITDAIWMADHRLPNALISDAC